MGESKERAEREREREMKRGIEGKDGTKEESSIHTTVTTICHACAFSLGEKVQAFPFFLSHPTLFVVQSRNSRDPWESTWEMDSMGPIVFSTGKQPGLVERLSRVMKRGNTGARMRWDTTRKETNRRPGKENGRSNASCFSKVRSLRWQWSEGFSLREDWARKGPPEDFDAWHLQEVKI
ncbi:uncharacterized protein LOC105428220 isoform X2 [Pogonomyrmex barbatus]|uniref:Uncharacterized protein LOC105428220 isoform X2 n=1 Tax=Pogonomyrmex barbatus TaxID=144034 RepID=A0A8N1S693_9HYME|nr:uncharacterized protein LOC105428220 isoform X2 [Pogonomyrmex barbatus]